MTSGHLGEHWFIRATWTLHLICSQVRFGACHVVPAGRGVGRQLRGRRNGATRFGKDGGDLEGEVGEKWGPCLFLFYFFGEGGESRKSMDLGGILGKSVEEGLVGRSVLWVVVCFCWVWSIAVLGVGVFKGLPGWNCWNRQTQLSNEKTHICLGNIIEQWKKPYLFREYKGLYYPAIWGL